MVLEDLQWADDSTVECLRMLARRNSRSRLCLVLTYCASTGSVPVVAISGSPGRSSRVRGDRSWHCSHSRRPACGDACSIVSERWPRSCAIRSSRRAAETRGWPSGPSKASSVWARCTRRRMGGGLPNWWDDFDAVLAAALRDVIQEQIDRLPAADLPLLEIAATAGHEFTAETVAAAPGHPAPVSEIERRLRRMAARHLLVDVVEHPVRSRFGHGNAVSPATPGRDRAPCRTRSAVTTARAARLGSAAPASPATRLRLVPTATGRRSHDQSRVLGVPARAFLRFGKSVLVHGLNGPRGIRAEREPCVIHERC